MEWLLLESALSWWLPLFRFFIPSCKTATRSSTEVHSTIRRSSTKKPLMKEMLWELKNGVSYIFWIPSCVQNPRLGVQEILTLFVVNLHVGRLDVKLFFPLRHCLPQVLNPSRYDTLCLICYINLLSQLFLNTCHRICLPTPCLPIGEKSCRIPI